MDENGQQGAPVDTGRIPDPQAPVVTETKAEPQVGEMTLQNPHPHIAAQEATARDNYETAAAVNKRIESATFTVTVKYIRPISPEVQDPVGMLMQWLQAGCRGGPPPMLYVEGIEVAGANAPE